MPRVTRTIYAALPSAFNPALPGVGIGDLIVDPAGVAAPYYVKGPNVARTVAPLVVALPLYTLTITPGSSGAGNLQAVFTLKVNGLALSGAGLSGSAVVTGAAATAAIIVGNGVIIEDTVGGNLWLFQASTNIAGFVNVDFNGTSGDVVNIQAVFGDVTATLSVAIP